MLTLAELNDQMGKVFEAELKVPEPSKQWQRKLEALEEAGLEQQRSAAIFDMRCEQAEAMGFQELDAEEMVQMLMGETQTGDVVRDDLPRQKHEWVYNHHLDVCLMGEDCRWGGQPHDYFRQERKGLWYIPPFAKVEHWRCRFGQLDHLKREIPYGVVLRVNELKSLKLFNAFQVMAPVEAWERDTCIDPIVVAAIWEITKDESGTHTETAGQSAFYFVAQW